MAKTSGNLTAERLRSLWVELRSRVASADPDEFWDLVTTSAASNAEFAVGQLATRLAVNEGLCRDTPADKVGWLFMGLEDNECTARTS